MYRKLVNFEFFQNSLGEYLCPKLREALKYYKRNKSLKFAGTSNKKDWDE